MLSCILKHMNFMICKLYFNKAAKIKLLKSDRKEITAILERKNIIIEILKLNNWEKLWTGQTIQRTGKQEDRVKEFPWLQQRQK